MKHVRPHWILTTLLLAGCATTNQRAVTQIERNTCETAVQLRTAQALGVDREHTQTYAMDASSSCLATPAGPVRYRVFRLPEYAAPYSVTVDSEQTGLALFAPRLQLIDAEGRVHRKLEFEDFSLRGKLLRATVYFNAENAGERYLIVASALSSVGQTHEPIVSRVTIFPLLATTLIPMIGISGSEYRGQYTLSHNGLIRVRTRSEAPPRPEPEQIQPREIPAKLMTARQ